ncbi:MAG: hypothetical protein A3G09_02610, partial [Candidatus Moranbacteria bacterium RIFCSPLOWO2_12_FULL_48_12]
DLAVGAFGYSSFTGRAYIFYNDGSIPTTAATADIIITGASTFDDFGRAITAGDFNSDGTIDIAVSAPQDSTGKVNIFYNDGSIPTAAGSADVIIAGIFGSDLGLNLTAGDLNMDGRTDLVIADESYSSSTGRVYILYNDGAYPADVSTADVTLTGGAAFDYFGSSIASGDFNADGKTDLAVGAYGYASFNLTGRAYIFYNDGAYPAGAATADVTLTGETTSNYFGYALASGDFNNDGKADLAVGAYGYSTSTGRVYIYQGQGNYAWTVQALPPSASVRSNLQGAGQEMQITGQVANGLFGISLVSGDFNADGKTDLAIGATNYSPSTGRAYIFYNDGSYTTTASSADVIITGETTSSIFGVSLTAGDFNTDGKTDLAVGANQYSSQTGRVYLFYNDGSYPASAAAADVILTGEVTGSYFGSSLVSGDFNADGKTDLAVGAYGYTSQTGRVYLFYNDGAYPAGASTADVTLTGGAMFDFFGYSLASGDFNADGKTDLTVGAYAYTSFNFTGRAYIFYNDGSYPAGASTADVILTGEATNSVFGVSLTAGDFNADGKTDLAVGATGYSTTGRAYIFYNDGSYPAGAATADVTLTGETGSGFGGLASGDFNADGKTDLAVGASSYSTNTGRVYIFYNDGSYPAGASTADLTLTGETTSNYFGSLLASGDFNNDGKADLAVGAYGNAGSRGKVYMYTFNDPVITGETTNNYFGYALTSGDFNADGKTDLAVGAYGYSTSAGRTYIFYNDGSYPAGAASADVTLTGETTSNYFGFSLVSGDFNADGKTDLAVGAFEYSSSTGRAYIFYNGSIITENASGADVIITGGTTNNYFGRSLAAGDFNADGRMDLAVGAYRYSSFTGRAYIFYNDGSIPTTAATADVIITGLASSLFGDSLASGDFNADGTTDLVVTSSLGNAYLFYNDGSIPTTAATADVIITSAGSVLAAGDFNADGTTDLAIGNYSVAAYLFYNDGSIPTTAATADVIITGEASSFFGSSLASGDYNADGRTDLAVGAYGYSTNTGRVHIFYNDGSIPTTAATADVIITGQTTSNSFGISITSGDFNSDGKTDLAVGAYGYSSYAGRAYIFITEVKLAGSFDTQRLKGTTKYKGTVKFK